MKAIKLIVIISIMLIILSLSSVYAKSISGYAWDDANKDGEFNEESEIKLPNIEAELLRVNEDESEEVIQTTKTDTSGNYRFDGLGDGRYKVRFKYGTYNQFIEQGTAKYNGQDYRTTGSGVSVSDIGGNNFTLIIDVSGSMSSFSGEESGLQLIKRILNSLVEDLEGQTTFSLIEFETTARELISNTSDIGELKNIINGLTTKGGTNIAPALQIVLDKTNETDYENMVVMLFTDGYPADMQETAQKLREIDSKGIQFIAVTTSMQDPFLDENGNPITGKVYQTSNSQLEDTILNDVKEEVSQIITNNEKRSSAVDISGTYKQDAPGSRNKSRSNCILRFKLYI